MMGEPVSVTIERPSMRTIRDTKLQMTEEWEARNGMPCEAIVHREYSIAEGCAVARITVRSIIPATMKWSA